MYDTVDDFPNFQQNDNFSNTFFCVRACVANAIGNGGKKIILFGTSTWEIVIEISGRNRYYDTSAKLLLN